MNKLKFTLVLLLVATVTFAQKSPRTQANGKVGETTIDIENELKKAINYERNRQLNQYSKIYYNKIKKNLDFNG